MTRHFQVNLSNNQLESVPRSIFDLSSLKSLDLMGNQIGGGLMDAGGSEEEKEMNRWSQLTALNSLNLASNR